ncbi:MAG: hypothetical protein LC624_05945 [Halobacteriales archaeon]|nr:hypothetical protein [Halobacteriales archaeon]
MMPPTEVRRYASQPIPVEHMGQAESTVATSVCGACGKVHAPARAHRCLVCGSRDLRPGRAALQGTLESFTEVRAGKERPTGLALVRLDEGPMLTVELVLGGSAASVGARVAGVAVRGSEGQPKLRFRFALLPDVQVVSSEAVAEVPR